MKVSRYTNDDRSLWNQFVEKAKNTHFMFHRDYLEYHFDRFNDFSLVVKEEDGEVLGVLPANLATTTLHSHEGLTFGGLCIGRESTTGSVLRMFDSVVSFLRETGLIDSLIYKRLPDFYTTYPSQEDLYALFDLGAKLVRRDLNLVVEMANPVPFSELRLRGVRKAKKLGVIVEEADSLSEYWEVLESVLSARHGVKPVHSLAEIEGLRRDFPTCIRCFVARQQGEVIAGALIYETPAVAHTQYLANSLLGREIGGLDLVIHELITNTFARKKYFSLGTSTEVDGKALNTGLISQKEGFGARAYVHETYSLPINENEW